jgi:hypothetical protein
LGRERYWLPTPPPATHFFGFTAITDQTNHKKKLKSVSKQHF